MVLCIYSWRIGTPVSTCQRTYVSVVEMIVQRGGRDHLRSPLTNCKEHVSIKHVLPTTTRLCGHSNKQLWAGHFVETLD